MLLAQRSIGDAAETTASVHALLLDDPPRPVVTIDDDDLGTDIRMHEELKRVKIEKNSRLRRRCGRLRIKLERIGEDSRGVSTSVHMSIWKRHSYQLGTTFLQLSVLDFHSTFELSIFWNTCSYFFLGCTPPIR